MVTPSRRIFRELASLGKWIPVAACLPLEATAQEIFQAACLSPPHILLESARTHPVTGRYSLMVGEPTGIFTAKANQIWLKTLEGTRTFHGNLLESLQGLLSAKEMARLPHFPPFEGGAVGFLGFDAYRYIEPLPSQAIDDLNLPDLSFLLCDEAIVLDHLLQKLWVIVLAESTGDLNRVYDEAVGKIDALVHRIKRSPDRIFRNPAFTLRQAQGERLPFLVRGEPVEPPISTHARAAFEAMVRQAQGFIAQGQIYQANLSQRFTAPLAEEPWTLYQRLRGINPSPFAAFADFGFLQIACASPERFLRVQDRCVETRPIAGTRPKGTTPVETARLRQELILNEKERAEHLMLVDLERNDLGRVCRYGSVRVDELMVLEEYSHVIHIVSNVRGTLASKVRPMDLVAATFPGGTITGCPKIRSIEIIDALEPVRRQLYTGSLGYISYTGDMDLNLLIRTAFVVKDRVYVQTGAGIVADSDPGREYEETLHKAQALMEALQGDKGAAAYVAEPVSGARAF